MCLQINLWQPILIVSLNQSVNDTEAHPWLGQVDYELKFLKIMREEKHFLWIVDRVP